MDGVCLALEEINLINIQEFEDENASPTLKLRRVVFNETDSAEKRILRWLDEEGIIQVDPSSKREDYYQQRRDNMIKQKQHTHLPSLLLNKM